MEKKRFCSFPIDRRLRLADGIAAMWRLKDRQKYIPNGFQFYDPATGWAARQWMSFQGICEGLRAARLANPAKTAQFKLQTSMPDIEDEVDSFNATLCRQLGWNDYIFQASGGEPMAIPFIPPPPAPILSEKLRNVAAGAETLVEWISSLEEAAPSDTANKRAAVCASCPLNAKGDWTRFFTQPAANAIRHELERRRHWHLWTEDDDKLFVCQACLCPLKLLVHCPLKIKLKHMTPESHDALWSQCWIREEEKLAKPKKNDLLFI